MLVSKWFCLERGLHQSDPTLKPKEKSLTADRGRGPSQALPLPVVPDPLSRVCSWDPAGPLDFKQSTFPLEF